MRIGVFSLAYDPFLGGAETALKEIIKRSEHDFTVFTHRFDKDWNAMEIAGNCQIVRLGRGQTANSAADYYGRPLEKLLYVLRAWRAAERAHRKEKFTAIWVMMASYGGLAALLFKLRHPSIPMLLTLQEGDSEGHIISRVGFFYPFWRLIFKKADYIQVISNYLEDFARRHGAVCPIEVVPNGVDLGKFKVESLKLKGDRKVIITTSRLVPKNGVDVLIRAFAKLGDRTKEYRLRILGDGPDRPELEKLAAGLGVKSRVDFLGQVPGDQVPGYLESAQIFARPSRSEGLGNSFLEAMAAGLVVIGTPVGGIPDFLKNRETGLMARSEDSNDLAVKIRELIADSELRSKLAENGQKLAMQRYGWEGIARDMGKIFGLLAGPKLALATGIYPPEIGGPATYAALLEKELPKRGWGVAVLPFRIARSLPIGIRHLIYFWKIFGLARKSKLVFAQDTISVGLPAMIAAKICGRPFVIRVPGDYVWEQSVQRFGVRDGIDEFQNKKYGWRVELMRLIQRFVVGNADVVITPSKYFQKLVSRWTKNPEKVTAIYNGIDFPKIDSDSAIRSKTIITAGRLVPWKGFDVLIEIMQNLPDWRLEIVGDGPDRETLKLKVESLKLQKRVEIIGQIPREELLARLRDAGLFILNTSFESFSFQVVEAMHAGAPVIATNIGNLAEIVENNKEGILVDPNNRKEILAAIHKIDSDTEFREMIIKNARKKAEHFSIENTIHQVSKILSIL